MCFVFLASGREVKAIMYYVLCDRSIQALYSENQYSVYIDRQQCWGDLLLYCITYGNLSRWPRAPCASLPERRK